MVYAEGGVAGFYRGLGRFVHTCTYTTIPASAHADTRAARHCAHGNSTRTGQDGADADTDAAVVVDTRELVDAHPDQHLPAYIRMYA